MIDVEEVANAKGKRVIFKHEVGEAGDIGDAEKVGQIVAVGDLERDFPIKVSLMNIEERIVTYLNPSEVLRIID
jgi:hypothetical protein